MDKTLELLFNAASQFVPCVTDRKDWDVVANYPGIDPLVWLSVGAGWSCQKFGGNYLGRAGVSGDLLSQSVLYGKPPGLFRKDVAQVRGEDSAIPLAMVGSVCAGKDIRSELSLDNLLQVMCSLRPHVVVLEVSITGLPVEEVQKKIEEVCCAEGHGRKMVLWLAYSLKDLAVPCDGQRYLCAFTKFGTSGAAASDFARRVLRQMTEVPPYRAQDCLMPPGSSMRKFLDECRRRTLQRLAEEQRFKGEAQANAPQGAEPIDDNVEPVRKKARKNQCVKEIMDQALQERWFSDTEETLPLISEDYEALPNKSSWLFVLAKILASRGQTLSSASGDDFQLYADTSKKFNMSQGVLPRLGKLSEILCCSKGAESGYARLQLLHPEELLAFHGYALGTLSLRLQKTHVARTVAEVTSVPASILALLVAMRLCQDLGKA